MVKHGEVEQTVTGRREAEKDNNPQRKQSRFERQAFNHGFGRATNAGGIKLATHGRGNGTRKTVSPDPFD